MISYLAQFLTILARLFGSGRAFVLSHQRSSLAAAIVLLFILIPMPSQAVEFGCNLSDGINPFRDFDLGCMIGEFLLDITSTFAWITGNILDLVVKLFVFEMSETLETGSLFSIERLADGTPGIPVYRQVWFIVRDLANLSFIFILIYAAFATIFRISGVNIKRVVPQLVIVAILMNFSLFFVQVGVDFSNYIAYQFFTNVQVAVTDTNGDNEFVQIGSSQQQGLSSVIMNVTKVTALVASPTQLASNQTQSGTPLGQPGFAFGFFAAIFVFIAALVMLAGAMLLFIRFFMILIYMIASPIAFAASIIESGKTKITKGWWLKGLVNQLAFAPAYFGLMYLALYFLGALSADAGLGNADGSLGYWVRNAFVFLVSSGFLIYAIVAAKQIGVQGAQLAQNFVKRTGFAGVFGGTAAVGRNTIGRLGRRYVNSNQDRLRQRIAKGGLGGQVARLQLKTGDKLQKSSFDARLGIDRIPGIKMADISYGNRDDVKKGLLEREKEKVEKKKEEALEVAESLTPEQRQRYAKRLETQKTGVRGGLGILQFITHGEAADGSLQPRKWSKALSNTFDNTVENVLENIETKLDPDDANILQVKARNIVNRAKNLYLRNDILLGGGIDDQKARKIFATQQADLQRELKDPEQFHEQRLDELDKTRTSLREQRETNIQKWREANNKLQTAIADGNVKAERAARSELDTLANQGTEIDNQINIVTNDYNELVANGPRTRVQIERDINEVRDVYSRLVKESRRKSGYINSPVAKAILHYKTTIKEREAGEQTKELLKLITEAVAKGTYQSDEIARATDASK